MFAAAWLMLGSLFYSLQLSAGSFPKPLTQQEEAHYLELAAQGLSAEEIVWKLLRKREKIKVLALVDTLEYLKSRSAHPMS